jgi:thiol-disulfide isomerase/thioredoxin
MAIRLPSVLYALLPTIRTGKNTVEMGILTSYLVGVQTPCEIAYGLLTRTTWNPGVDFSNCSDPFAQYMISVRREGDAGFYCREFDRAFENYCRSLETRTVRSIEAYDRSGSLVARQLHADSMYVLHFWGTWCKPCIDNHEDIMAVSDSLEALGCRVLHIAYQVRQSMPAWQKFVSIVPGEQYLVATDVSNESSIVSILNVANYPSYVIIDRGNRVDFPWPYWHDAVIRRVRDLTTER